MPACLRSRADKLLLWERSFARAIPWLFQFSIGVSVGRASDHKFAGITAQQVLHHTAGIPDFLSMPAYWQKLRDTCTTSEAVAIFKTHPLRFEPGSQWEYSNSGYVLLGFIIEKITGQSLASYLEENILTRLRNKSPR